MKVITTVAGLRKSPGIRRWEVVIEPWKAGMGVSRYLLGAALGYRLSYSVLYTEVPLLCAPLIGSQM